MFRVIGLTSRELNSEFCSPRPSTFHIEVVVETELTVSRGLVIKCLLTHDT